MARELHHGGSERQLTETALGLDRKYFEPRVAAFHINGIRANELRAAGVPVIEFPVRSFKSPKAFQEAINLAKYVRKNDIHLVHTFDPPSSAFALGPVHLFTKAVAVGSQRGHMSLAIPAVRRMSLFGQRLADGVVVNCKFMMEHLMQAGIPERRIHLCYNGLDLTRFHRGERIRPPSIPGDALVIGTACVLRPEKGLPTLLEAFARIRPEFSNTKLLVLGSGPLLPALREQAAALGITSDCIFEPSTGDVAPWLRNMDIFVLPSLSEAFSNALMEAMGSGCCPVASRVGGTPELISDGERGLLFEPGDVNGLTQALQKVVADADLRSQLAGAAHDFIHSGFSRETAACTMGRIYMKMISARFSVPNGWENQIPGLRSSDKER